jgi:hypothetical protein
MRIIQVGAQPVIGYPSISSKLPNREYAVYSSIQQYTILNILITLW